MKQHIEKCRRLWRQAANDTFQEVGGKHGKWTNVDKIVDVLNPFMGSNINHTHFPSRGGMNMVSVDMSEKPGMLEFRDNGCVFFLAPNELVFEHFPDSPLNSFLLLKASSQDSWGGYRKRDEFTEIRSTDNGVQAHVLGGKFLIVSEGGVYNNSRTYDGRHENATSQNIRNFIEKGIQYRDDVEPRHKQE